VLSAHLNKDLLFARQAKVGTEWYELGTDLSALLEREYYNGGVEPVYLSRDNHQIEVKRLYKCTWHYHSKINSKINSEFSCCGSKMLSMNKWFGGWSLLNPACWSSVDSLGWKLGHLLNQPDVIIKQEGLQESKAQECDAHASSPGLWDVRRCVCLLTGFMRCVSLCLPPHRVYEIRVAAFASSQGLWDVGHCVCRLM